MCKIRHLCHIVFLLFALNLTFRNMRFQALVEVDHAFYGRDKCCNDEDDGDDSEGC